MDYFFDNIRYRLSRDLDENICKCLVEDVVSNVDCLTNLSIKNVLYLDKDSGKLREFFLQIGVNDFDDCNDKDIFYFLEYILTNNQAFHLEKKYDAIISPQFLNYAKSITQSLVMLKEVMRPNAFLMAYLVGENNFIELRNAFFSTTRKTHYNHFVPRLNIKTAGELLQYVGFEDIVTTSLSEVYYFDNFYEIHSFVKSISQGNPFLDINEFRFNKINLQEMQSYYEINFTSNNKLKITVDLISIFCIKR